MAELLSAVVLFQLAAPGCPLIASPEPASADLRSGLYVCGARPRPEPRRWPVSRCASTYGLPTQGGGFGGDAKAPDFQDGVEGGGVLDVLVGADSLVGLGCFDGAQATSLATIVLHDDAAGLVKQELRRASFDAASCLIDDIRAVGPGGHYMGAAQHASSDARDAWQPSVLRRGTFEAYRGRTLVQDALERARELLATHEVPPLPDDVERHIDEVIAAQWRLAVRTA